MDLIAALNASVKAAEESRGEHGQDSTVDTMQSRKKPASKKTTTRQRSAS
ncbi:hypothetical protein [Streptomyces sp. NPDC006510]